MAKKKAAEPTTAPKKRAKKTTAKANQSVAARKKAAKKKAAAESATTTKKKKMTKKEAAVAWDKDNIQATTSKLMTSTMNQMAVEYGDPFIAAAGEAGRIVVGIQLPFAFEYLIQNSVLPLGRMTCIVGATHCNKSAFAYEMIRWLKPYAGQGYILENETKASPDLAHSVIGYEDEGEVTPWGLEPCYSVEDWQEKLQRLTDRLRTVMTQPCDLNNQHPPGRVFPVFVILDSIMGKLSEETQGKIEERGYADREFAVEALKITAYLKKYPQDIAAWPIHFIAVNHLKKQKAQTGHHMERNKAGGKHIDFQQTFEFELSRISKIKKVDADSPEGFEIGGNHLKLKCYKNGLGEDQHEIKIPIVWRHRRSPVDGQIRQYTKWDWHTAAADLLMGFDEGSKKQKIQEIVDIRAVKGGKFWSNALSVPKDDPVEKAEIGRLVSRNSAVRNALRDQLGIKRRKVFQKGVDYLDQIEVLRADIEEGMLGDES